MKDHFAGMFSTEISVCLVACMLYRVYKLEPKARVLYLIQHGRECGKWLVKLSNFMNLLAK